MTFVYSLFPPRALGTSLKGFLLYSVSGRYPPLRLSRLFPSKQHWIDEQTCPLFLWYGVRSTNDRSVISYQCLPLCLQSLFLEGKEVDCVYRQISIFSVNSEICEGCLCGFKTFEFIFIKIGMCRYWGISSHRVIEHISVLLIGHKQGLLLLFTSHEDCLDSPSWHCGSLDFCGTRDKKSIIVRKGQMAWHWKGNVYLQCMVSHFGNGQFLTLD